MPLKINFKRWNGKDLYYFYAKKLNSLTESWKENIKENQETIKTIKCPVCKITFLENELDLSIEETNDIDDSNFYNVCPFCFTKISEIGLYDNDDSKLIIDLI